MSNVSIKRGMSFQLSCIFRDAEGEPVSLSGCTIQSQIRDAQGVLLAALSSAQPARRPGVVNVFYAGSTSAWPAGRYFCDVIVLRADGVMQATETFGVVVNPAITQWGSQT